MKPLLREEVAHSDGRLRPPSRAAGFVWACVAAFSLTACERRTPTTGVAAAIGTEAPSAAGGGIPTTPGRAPPGAAMVAMPPAPESSAPSARATTAFYASVFEKRPDVPTLTALGRRLFADASLSASGRLACASCHDAAHAYGPPDGRAVRSGGADLRQPGVRAVPSLRYQQDTPPFTEHFSDSDGNDSVDQGPAGGRSWDGRAQSAHEQAEAPLLSRFEMANASRADAIARLRRSPSAEHVREAFGAHVLDDDALAWNALVLALEVFQESPPDFYPYTSKYDAFLRRQAALTPRELRGLALFNDPGKGNCALCHPSAIKRGVFPQFSDRGFIALGVPRNPEIAANRDPAYFDLGLCGPLRTDLENHPEYCGLFKAPSLRNVATRRVFFHNGRFHRLGDAVAFYAERDLRPQKFYPRDAAGKVAKYDDLPESFRDNLHRDAPFDREAGDRPALNAGEIADIVVFLRTLTDGYAPPAQKKRVNSQ